MTEYRTIRLTKTTYEALDKCRKTSKGKVSFESIIKYLLDNVKEFEYL